MSAHTPGPWTVGAMWVHPATRQIIADKGASGLPCMPAIACGRDDAGAEANARLIAAAPKMLELIENLATGWTSAEDTPVRPAQDAITSLRSLLQRYRADARAILRDVEGENNG